MVRQNDASLFPRQIRGGANDAWRNSINCLGIIRIFADSCLHPPNRGLASHDQGGKMMDE